MTPDQGLCLWTSPGAPPPDPRYRIALRARHGLGFSTFFIQVYACFQPFSVYLELTSCYSDRRATALISAEHRSFDCILHVAPICTLSLVSSRKSQLEQHLDRFSRFCMARPCVQHTDTQTQTDRHLRRVLKRQHIQRSACSVNNGHILASG